MPDTGLRRKLGSLFPGTVHQGDISRAQVIHHIPAGIAAYFADTNQQDALVSQVRKTLANILDSGKRHRYSAAAKFGLVLDRLRRLKYAVYKALQERAHKTMLPRQFYRLFYLPHDLIITQDLRVNTGGDHKQMLDRLRSTFDIRHFQKPLLVTHSLRTQKFRQLTGVVRKSIDLGPVTSGKDKKFCQVMRWSQRQKAMVVLVADGKLSADIGVRFFVVDPHYVKS